MPMNDKDNEVLKEMTATEFLGIGLHQIAYIRPINAGDEGDDAAFSIHAADGTQLSVTGTYNEAVMAARTNDLFPVTLH